MKLKVFVIKKEHLAPFTGSKKQPGVEYTYPVKYPIDKCRRRYDGRRKK